MNKAKVPVLVLGTLQAALGSIRAFGRRGIPVFGLADETEYVSLSRFYRRFPGSTGPTPAPSAQALQDVLAAHHDGLVLCPCSDHWTAVTANFFTTEDLFIAVAAPDTLSLLQDKSRFTELLMGLKISHPRTIVMHDPSALNEVPDDLLGSAFLKPTDSQRFSETYGRKALWVADRDEAFRVIAEARSRGLELMLQEYVPGGPTCHYFIDGYCSAGGNIAALFARQRLRMFPSDFGNSTLLVSIGLDQVRPAIQSLERILGAIGYRGIFSAEFKRDPRDGSFRIIEINTRPWLFVDFAVRSGVDVCHLSYLDAQGEPLGPMPRYREGLRCIAPVKDFHAVRLQRGSPARWLGWLFDMIRSRQPIWALDDPSPGLSVVRSTLTKAAGNRLRRLGRGP